MRNYVLIGLLLTCPFSLKAQQEPQFSQYIFNQPVFNPASVGINPETTFSLTHRTQWAGYNPSFDEGGTPQTQVFYATTQLPILRSGIGFHVVNDQLGALTNRELKLSYAFHVRLNNATLAIGISGGIYAITLDFNKLRPLEQEDPLILSGSETQTNTDAAVGIYYQGQNWFGAVSVSNLTQPNFNFGAESIQRNLLANTGYFLLGYQYTPTTYWEITPSILVKADVANVQNFSFDASTFVTYNQQFFGGLSYRYQDAATITAGAYLPYRGNMVRIGYSFDYIVQGQAGKQPTSHEITLAYILPVSEVVKKPVIRTPRFIYD